MFLVVSMNSEVLYANSAFLERFGLSKNALSKNHFHDLYESRGTEEVVSSLRQAFNGKSVAFDVPLSPNRGAALKVTTRIAKAVHGSQEVPYAIVQEVKSQ